MLRPVLRGHKRLRHVNRRDINTGVGLARCVLGRGRTELHVMLRLRPVNRGLPHEELDDDLCRSRRPRVEEVKVEPHAAVARVVYTVTDDPVLEEARESDVPITVRPVLSHEGRQHGLGGCPMVARYWCLRPQPPIFRVTPRPEARMHRWRLAWDPQPREPTSPRFLVNRISDGPDVCDASRTCIVRERARAAVPKDAWGHVVDAREEAGVEERVGRVAQPREELGGGRRGPKQPA